jgi:hypothetical protein
MKESAMSRPEKAPYLALVGGLLIGLLSILPYFSSTLEYIPGDPGDTRLSIYSLEHGYKWITGQTGESFFDAPFFYPARESMRYTDTFFGGLPFYLPFRMLGIDRETSFQLFIIVGYALNFLVAGWVFNRMRFHWLATVGGAFVFAFSQAALTHSWHIQLHYRFAIPLALYFLYTFLKDFSPSRLLGTLFFGLRRLFPRGVPRGVRACHDRGEASHSTVRSESHAAICVDSGTSHRGVPGGRRRSRQKLRFHD